MISKKIQSDIFHSISAPEDPQGIRDCPKSLEQKERAQISPSPRVLNQLNTNTFQRPPPNIQ